MESEQANTELQDVVVVEGWHSQDVQGKHFSLKPNSHDNNGSILNLMFHANLKYGNRHLIQYSSNFRDRSTALPPIFEKHEY